MSRWYLLFDDSCPKCRWTASQLVSASRGRITRLDLCSDAGMALLDRAHPRGWKWSPYLVRTGGARVRAWRGRDAKLLIGLLLGPVGVWRYWRAVRTHHRSVPGDDKRRIATAASAREPVNR